MYEFFNAFFFFRTLAEMVKRREKSKREMINLTLDIVEKRFILEDFRDELFSHICNEAKPSFRFSKVRKIVLLLIHFHYFTFFFLFFFSKKWVRFRQTTKNCRRRRRKSVKRPRRWPRTTKDWSVESGCFRTRKNGIDRRLRFCCLPKRRHKPRPKSFR